MFIYNNTFVECDVYLSEWTNPTIRAHNNLFYHSQKAQRFYDVQSDPWSQLDADHNLFFSTTGDTQWRHLYRNKGSALAAWQQYSGNDKNSVWKDPQFVDPIGSKPEGFKRWGDPKNIRDVAEGKYGTVCGAYITADETIGLIVEKSPERTRSEAGP